MAKSKPKSRDRVGIVGLGIMGGAFARNLMKNGWQVVGYDTNENRRRELGRAGVEIVEDAATVAQAAPVIITSLPKPETLHAVAKNIAATKLPKRIVVETSTFTLDDKLKAEKALKAAGHVVLDCPISGTGAQARTGDLVVYASGDKATIRKLKPLFAAFSRAAHDLGPFGNGSKMKYVANLLVAIHNVASAEAMVLGMKSGLAPEAILQLATAGVGNSRILELRGPLMVKSRYDEPTMKVGVWQKDMQVIGEFARAIGVPTPLFDATVPIYDAAMAQGHEMHDTASVCAVLEREAGVKRKNKAG
jgi:3-hydroxyisobutyrate dehydrogenase-like beta-hydroxyacid dehydrogenase